MDIQCFIFPQFLRQDELIDEELQFDFINYKLMIAQRYNRPQRKGLVALNTRLQMPSVMEVNENKFLDDLALQIKSLSKDRYSYSRSLDIAEALSSNLIKGSTIHLDNLSQIQTIPGSLYRIPQLQNDYRLVSFSKQFVVLKFVNLQEHNYGRELYICQIGSCAKIVNNIYNFFDHLRSHTKEKPFRCTY